jgi:hypothetical protein
MPVPRSAAFAVVAALLVCAGCVPTTPPGPLPQATPSWSCTPVAGGTPYPCYEHDYQEAAAQNKLHQEAETVFRKYNAEYERIYRLGGVSEPTAVLLETATGEALESAMSNFRDLLSDGTRLVSGRFEVAWIKRMPGLVEEGSVATLEVCGDVSDAVLQAKGKKPHKVGQDKDERYYFFEAGGQLKLGIVEHKWVKAC